jgi:uncharacterized Zn-finger protein
MSESKNATPIELKATDLNTLGGVHCPNPTMPNWSSHPKVFIDIAKHGQGRCHYCGTVYQLAAGETTSGVH